jgi:hypothetical protein
VFGFSLQLLSETFLIIRRTERDMIKNVSGNHEKHPLFLSDFNKTWIFSTFFREILKYSWKSVRWETSYSMRTNGRTWRISQSLFAILRTRIKTCLSRKKSVKAKFSELMCKGRYFDLFNRFNSSWLQDLVLWFSGPWCLYK